VNPPDPHVRPIGLGCSQDVRESRVITIIREERSCIDGWMVVVVVRKLRHQEEVGPIVLTVRTEHAEIGFHPLVVVFDLSLRLRMIGGREAGFYSESLVEAFRKRGGEG